MKCNIVRDLLPLYLDGMASRETVTEVDEHLKDCSECSKILDQMKTDIDPNMTVDESSELDYLKKIRCNSWIKIIVSVLVAVGILSTVGYLYLFGSPVEKSDMVYTIECIDQPKGSSENSNEIAKEISIEFKLNNDKELLVKPLTVWKKDSDGNKHRKIDYVALTPREVLQSPVMEDVQTEFTFGYMLNADQIAGKEHVSILKIKFKDAVIVINPLDYVTP